MAMGEFYYGIKSNFDALQSKNSNALYFLTDTRQIFKGDQEYTKSCRTVRVLPTENQLQGVIYVRLTDMTFHIWDGNDYIKLNKENVTVIPDDPTNDTVPTTKAVADYVAAKIQESEGKEGHFVTDVSYKDGVLSVSKNGDPVPTTLTGVVHAPTYDPETRTIKMPVFGGDELSITLGKDLVVKSGVYNAETQNIELTITTGEVIKIPVGSLIDIYIGAATSTAEVTVSDDNKISVKVKVSAKANNAITIEDDGIYTPIPDSYTKAETDAKVKAVQDQFNEHKNDTTIHITADERKAWNEKVTHDELNAAKDAAIATAADDATTKADAALASAKAYTDTKNESMDTRVQLVESALTWKQIASATT